MTTKTIGASSADFTTLSAWEAAAAADLTSPADIYEGQEKDPTDHLTDATTLVTIAGSTTNASGYKHLTTAAGASFRDHASVQSNALRFNPANGAALSVTGGFQNAIILDENFVRLSNLQISAVNTSSRALSMNGSVRTNLDIDGCILESNSFINFSGFGGKVRNSLIICRESGAASICDVGFASIEFINCTFVVPSDLTPATACFVGNFASVTLKNCAIFGASALTDGSGSTTYSYTTCMTDVASPPAGCTTVTYANQFQNTTNAASDFRLKAGADCIDAGTTDSTNAATDIAGTARPLGAAYDVGAWEGAAAAGGGGTGAAMTHHLQQMGAY